MLPIGLPSGHFSGYFPTDVLQKFTIFPVLFWKSIWDVFGDRSGTLVKVLCYKSEGRWFVPSWCYWNFSLT